MISQKRGEIIRKWRKRADAAFLTNGSWLTQGGFGWAERAPQSPHGEPKKISAYTIRIFFGFGALWCSHMRTNLYIFSSDLQFRFCSATVCNSAENPILTLGVLRGWYACCSSWRTETTQQDCGGITSLNRDPPACTQEAPRA